MTLVMQGSFFFEDLNIGMAAIVERRVSDSDVHAFADISGDKNPLHLDPVFAAKTPFKGCITHGMLTAAYISAVFGMKLPGPGAIYVSQTLNFLRPVRVGDTVLTKVSVAELFPAKRRARFDCICSVAGNPVLTGEAVLMVPGRPV